MELVWDNARDVHQCARNEPAQASMALEEAAAEEQLEEGAEQS